MRQKAAWNEGNRGRYGGGTPVRGGGGKQTGRPRRAGWLEPGTVLDGAAIIRRTSSPHKTTKQKTPLA